MGLCAVIVKASAGYKCVKCGSMDKVQAHHQIRGDDSSMICLCASCHADEHPEVPRALFFAGVHQPYWFNKSAAQLARENGVCWQTIIRIAKVLNIMRGELSFVDEVNIIGHLQKVKAAKAQKESEATIRWVKAQETARRANVYCPHCNSKRKLIKAGYAYTSAGKKQRYLCKCRKTTIKPRVSK